MRIYLPLLLLAAPLLRAQDSCATLEEAEQILESLQPAPDAHLHSKLPDLAPFGNRGWADGLGWSQDGPLSTTLRLLPRVFSAISPTRLLSQTAKTIGRKGNAKISRSRKGRAEKVLELVQEAEEAGCDKVWRFRGRLRMFPPRGIKQDLAATYEAYKKHLEIEPDPEAQFILGVLHSTGLGGIPIDQGKALLYYTFAAAQGYRPAAMALGYRHWAGIGVKEDCGVALEHYSHAADISYRRFLDGPPGGLTLPLTPIRLSDRVGGIYGPHASWASTGANSLRPAIRASIASARGETTQEILEYYQYHSDRDSYIYAARLGRLFYHGSVHFSANGVSSGAESVGAIPQSFHKARTYFLKVARVLWPTDFLPGTTDQPAGRRKLTKEQEDKVREAAMISASFLGRMALRGEGQKVDYQRAKMWYERAAELGDREALNGLGILYRDGLGVPVDLTRAQGHFQAAAAASLPEAQVNVAKLLLNRGEYQAALPFLDSALRGGNPLEAFHLSAQIHTTHARSSKSTSLPPAMCGVAVAYEKLVSERGSWNEDFLLEADEAWARGEEGKAMMGWYIAAEMGYEIAQNNVAFMREGGWQFDAEREGEWEIGKGKAEEGDTRALVWWLRSAAQDNVDAMVKVGDYYYSKRDYPHALAHYLSASETQQSPMAYWNLGWMYQSGQGVARDWHLAKRYYDLSRETGEEAGLAVWFSLWGLYLQSWWTHFKTRGSISGLPLFEPPTPSDSDTPLGTWSRLKSLFTSPFQWAELEFDEDWENALEPEGIVLGEGDHERGGGALGEAGNGGGEGREWEGETMGEMMEDLLLIGLMFGIGGLMWLRARWAAMAGNGGRVQGHAAQAQAPIGGGVGFEGAEAFGAGLELPQQPERAQQDRPPQEIRRPQETEDEENERREE
ncbi:SEL1 protein [Cryptococcus neoformans Tu401-1]|nr:SEL1 protein [Cryptococcus neoformans var. grubii Tu401-1]